MKEKTEAVERRIKAIRQRIDRLDNAFLYEPSIDIDIYDRHKERLNEELTLARMDRHATQLEEWTWRAFWASQSAFYRAPHAGGSRPRSNSASAFSSCFSRRGLRSTEKRLFESVRTALTAPAFNWLQPEQPSKTSLVDQNSASWNRVTSWLASVDALRLSA